MRSVHYPIVGTIDYDTMNKKHNRNIPICLRSFISSRSSRTFQISQVAITKPRYCDTLLEFNIAIQLNFTFMDDLSIFV